MTNTPHENSHADAYKAAGVDITAGYEAVRQMQAHIRRTKNGANTDEIGGFGGLFVPDLTGMRQPVLVSGTDGVGTKLKIAFLMDKHDTVGIDLVAMSVNDVLCCGAKPLFFLDYIAASKIVPEKIAEIVGGIAEGCVQAGAVLIGGETAEMPGMYAPEEYDLAGFAVGIADREKMIRKDRTRAGDVLLALPSSGLHSNGFSLVRKILRVDAARLAQYVDELGATLGETLLTPTKIYVKPVLDLLAAVQVNGIAHITGGGFHENLPRALPKGLSAKIDRAALRVPPVFDLLQKQGDLPEREMFNTFNMGLGMALLVRPEDVDKSLAILRNEGAYVLGEICAGDAGVVFA
jgi:phosphoribosylformylglycinamidine cyclo-ligase